MSLIQYSKTTKGLLAFALIVGLAGPALALNVTLRADSFTKKINGRTITFWGYDKKVPGPVIKMPVGDTTLNIRLENRLPVPVSIFIPGLNKAMNPVKITDGSGRERVISFDAAVPAYTGGPTPFLNFTWTNVRPGSYVYHSAYDTSVQTQMGLYGALLSYSAANTAYPGVTFQNEGTLIYSDVDADLHDSVAAFTYGTSTSAFPSTNAYQPDYYLINGDVFPNGSALLDHPLVANEKLMVRLLNAGLKVVTPTLAEGTFMAVAEDANAYPQQREQYGILVPPGRTRDATYIVPAGPRPFRVTAREAGDESTTPPPQEPQGLITVPVVDRSGRSADNSVNVGQNEGGGGGGGFCFLRSLFEIE